MPHYNIHLRIVCGETTCAVKADDFCAYHRDLTHEPGEPGFCVLFGELERPAGWTLRHWRCLLLASPAEKPKGSA